MSQPKFQGATPTGLARSMFGSGSKDESVEEAIKLRNDSWESCNLIPSWVDVSSVDLDCFFTRTEVALECYSDLLEVMKSDYAELEEYRFIEPSAGEGSFFDMLPKSRRIGIEIVAGRPEFEMCDFLGWRPPANCRRLAVVGCPPFGSRSWLALAFVNRAATFSDYIGMILPMAFQSSGRGSPKHRVVGAELIQSRGLPLDAFTTYDGQPVAISAVWQVWKRGVNNRKPSATCGSSGCKLGVENGKH